MKSPFARTGNHDPKLALLRRADTERDSRGFSISGERKRKTLVGHRPITLAPVPSLAKPEPEPCMHDDPPRVAADGSCLKCGARPGADCGDVW